MKNIMELEAQALIPIQYQSTRNKKNISKLRLLIECLLHIWDTIFKVKLLEVINWFRGFEDWSWVSFFSIGSWIKSSCKLPLAHPRTPRGPKHLNWDKELTITHTCFDSIHMNYLWEKVWNCCMHNKCMGFKIEILPNEKCTNRWNQTVDCSK